MKNVAFWDVTAWNPVASYQTTSHYIPDDSLHGQTVSIFDITQMHIGGFFKKVSSSFVP